MSSSSSSLTFADGSLPVGYGSFGSDCLANAVIAWYVLYVEPSLQLRQQPVAESK